jgi:hypothetical protein
MKEYRGSGSIYAIFQWHAKNELNAIGEKPIYIKREAIENKTKNKNI